MSDFVERPGEEEYGKCQFCEGKTFRELGKSAYIKRTRALVEVFSDLCLNCDSRAMTVAIKADRTDRDQNPGGEVVWWCNRVEQMLVEREKAEAEP